jgi:antitoxin (DNA-binding transcriptional repressor) of toxin-antitoxin stability system
MKVVEITDAAGQIAALVAEAEQGEEIWLARSGRVIVQIQPILQTSSEADTVAALDGLSRIHDALAARGVSVSDEEIRAMRDDHRE